MTTRIGGQGPALPIPNADLQPSAKAKQDKATPAMQAPVDRFEVPAQNPFDTFGGKPNVLHDKQTPPLSDAKDEIARATGGVSSAPAEVTNALDEAMKTEIKTGKKITKGSRSYEEIKQSPELKGHFEAVKKGIATGDYKAALDAMKKANAMIENKTENGLDPSAKTMERQLEFLAAMQDKKIAADYPPTEKQLVAYFGTLKKDPAGARQAFEAYAQNFHVHIADEKGAGADITYKSTGKQIGGIESKAPDQWSEINGRPATSSRNVGKQLNDCEGFALMAEKLLTAAGFEVVGHVISKPSREKPKPSAPGDGSTPPDTTAGSSHDMTLFKHKSEKEFTVTSNDGAFTNPTKMGAAREGFAYASGERKDDSGQVTSKGNQTGKETFYLGPTAGQAMANLVNQDGQLK